ncbi:MAG TPA: hypothetical protein VEL69_05365 [Ktedonobacteraceae bacterium]|nr:hypothetical protein [Ktedonobacteraceae bacterium]
MARKQSRAPARHDSTTPRFRRVSGVLGAILLALAGIWLAWLLLHQFVGAAIPAPPVPSNIGVAPANPSDTQIAPLTAEGITLGHPDTTPGLSQQQALFISGQLEPNAASKAKTTSAQFVLLNYPNKGTPAAHADYHNIPAWMVLYQGIPLKPAAAAVDPTPSPRSTYNLYVFLDANSGKELLAIQA